MGRNDRKVLFIIVIAIVVSVLVLLLFGCKVNPAAERTCNDLWQYKVRVFLDNDELSISEKEQWIIVILQSLKYDDEQIMKELTAIRNTYGWQDRKKPISNDEANKPQSHPKLE